MAFGSIRKLIEGAKRCIMKNRQHEDTSMKTITLSPEDAAQVKAILETHAELSDNQAMPSLELIGRMKNDAQQDDELMEMIFSLQEQVNIFELDSDNLKRLSKLF